MSKLTEKLDQLRMLFENVVGGLSEVFQSAKEQEEENEILFSLQRERIGSLEEKVTTIQANESFGLGVLESLRTRLDNVEKTEKANFEFLDHHIDDLYSYKQTLQKDVEGLKAAVTFLMEGQIPDKPVEPKPEPTTPKLIIPEGSIIIPLQSTEIANISRSNSLVSTGIPIAEELNVTDISRLVLTVEEDNGNLTPIPADFRPIAWWRTPKSPDGIMFVQLSLIDSFAPEQKLNYRLAIVPETHRVHNPELSYGYLDAIHDKKSSTIMVDTGIARFTIGPEGVFRSVEQIGKEGQQLISSGITSITFDGKTDTFSDVYVRRMEIEYLGPLVCYILVEIITTSLAIGTFQTNKNPARFSTTRRYQFVRGSGICTVQNILTWEGTKNGSNHLMPDGKTLNSVIGTSWRDAIQTEETVSVVHLLDTNNTPLTFYPKSGISEIQVLRANRKLPRVAIIETDDSPDLVDNEAKGIMRIGSLVIGLQNMAQHEPQEIGFDPQNGMVYLEYASDKFHLAFNQGVCVTSILGITKESESIASIWADMNHPMRVFPVDSSYYNVSAFGPVPDNDFLRAQADLSLNERYQEALQAVCNKTLQLTSRDGLYGLMTSHSSPRSWDDTYIETSDKSPSWDSLYATSAFTDYYSTYRSPTILALMTENSKWLDSLSFPAAQRMLHTQIIHCAPEDNWSKAGWGFTGYAAYRSDGNSSHSYYENLFWYYLLTGDRLVIDTITRGERTVVNDLKTQNLSGRFPNQHMRAQRFLSHCHDQATSAFFQTHWRAFAKRAIDECYVEGTYNGTRIALWVDTAWNGSKFEPSKKKPGLLRTPNLYAFSIWDLETLWQSFSKYYVSTLDEQYELARKFILLVQTIQKYGSILASGDGSINKFSKWVRAFKFTWDGNPDPSKSIITNLAAGEDTDGTTTLYSDDIPGMCGSWSRAATLTNDPKMIENSRNIISYTLNRMMTTGQALNKLSGLMDSTLSAAIYEEEKRG